MPIAKLRTLADQSLTPARCVYPRALADGSIVNVPMPRVMLATQMDSFYWRREVRPKRQVGKDIATAYAGVACRPAGNGQRGYPFIISITPASAGRCIVRVEFKVFSFWRKTNKKTWWSGDVNPRKHAPPSFST